MKLITEEQSDLGSLSSTDELSSLGFNGFTEISPLKLKISSELFSVSFVRSVFQIWYVFLRFC